MLEHHLQKNIVFTLSHVASQRFGELKPADIENKLFDYHLKKVIRSGLVHKLDSGEYALTPLGRRVGKDALKQNMQLIDRAYSVLFMAVRRAEDGAWLLARRKTHPLLGQIGFVHAQPELHRHTILTAQEVLLNRTGLAANFKVRGSGYLRLYEADNLESFTHFTLLEATDALGDLVPEDDLAEYFWEKAPDFTESNYLPTLQLFVRRLAEPGLFFLEHDETSMDVEH